MAAGEVPAWLQALGALSGTGLVAGWLHWKEGRKEHPVEPAASVVAASVISDTAVAKVTQAIREAAESHHDDCRRVRESNGDLQDAVHSLERAIVAGIPPAAGVDMAAVMARLNKLEGR